MWKRPCAAGLLAAASALVCAQSTPQSLPIAPTAPTAPAKPDSAEAAAAMERAQRLAANPMRVILQAGKFKRRVEPELAVAAALPSTTLVAAASVAAVTRPAPEQQLAPAVLMTLADKLQGSASVEPMARLDAGPALTAPALTQAMPQAPGRLPTAELQRPRLVNMVEPTIPGQLLAEIGRSVEINVDLSLRADGSVADISRVAPYPRSWQRYLLSALSQWRFAPLPAPWVHRVQLVFSEPQ